MVTRKSTSQISSALLIIMFLLTGALRVQRVRAEPLASPLSANGDFLWAKSMGGTSSDYGSSIVVDSSGNVYTTGTFQGIADFDPSAGTANLTSVGLWDIFVSKSDSSGGFLWAKNMGGADYDFGQDIAVDSSGNIYTTGSFRGTADFDPGAGTANLTSVERYGVGSPDIFVSKLDSGGNFVWAKSMGGMEDDQVFGIVLDPSGNVYTTGSFEGTLDFDPGMGTANLTSAGYRDIFVSKLDTSGDFVWAKSMDGTNNWYDGSIGIALDSSGNVYMTGYFGDPLTPTSPSGNYDIFVSKLDSSGGLLWTKVMGGTSDDYGQGIAVDSNGNVYTTGFFQFTVDFDPGTGTANLISEGGFDIFVSKSDSNGDFLWAKSMGGMAYDESRNIAVDSRGSIYTTGYFYGTADFDPGAGIASLTSAGNRDIFVSKLDSNGDFAWAKSMGGAGLDQGNSIALDSRGSVYTTGSFESTADFDPGAGTTNLTSAGGEDTFVSKLDNSVIFADVLSSYWANSHIERLYNEGITGGCSAVPLNYCPDSTVTRAQMAVFLLKSIHGSSYIPPTVGVSTGFIDVPIGHWAAAWIKELAAEGITSGCGAGNYCPDATVTRAQMAVFLLKAKHGPSYSPPAAAGVFTDVPVGYWADKWIEQLAIEGVTSGCGVGIYCPDADVTRAQIAVFLVKAFNLP